MKHKILIMLSTVVLGMTTLSASAGSKVLYWFFSPSPSYQYEDDNVKVTIYQMRLWVYNKTDHVIYLDKETSFAYLNDVPTCLFTNAAYTNSSSQGTDTNVNLGGIARALGIGGAAGSIMSGVNVGGNQTQGSSTTVYEQPIVTIAPQSAYTAYNWGAVRYVLRDIGVTSQSWKAYIDPETKAKITFKKGMTWEYDETNSPLRLKGVINYFVDKDSQEATQVTVSKYMSNLIVDDANAIEESELCQPYKNQEYGGYDRIRGRTYP